MIVKGQKIDDRYLIIRNIGEGGMANVFLAHDTILDRDVAIKVLRGDLADDEKFVRRFRREALSASSLSHPTIVEVYDVGEDNNNYYIVMEFIDGKDLKELIKKRGNLTISEVIDIMLQVTEGIASAHDSYIIHRDIKPQNILLKEDGAIKITDFGIATALNSTQLTQTNSAMGTVYYLPPEQAAGKGSTIRSDIYSMGILLYELLTGTLPFRGDTPVEIALKHIKDPLPNIKRRNPNIPQSLENVILKSTAKNPKNRYANAKEMHDDLLTVMDESRKDEAVHVYKYNEHDHEENKKLSTTATPRRQVIEKVDAPLNENKFNKILWILSAILGFIIVAIATIFLILPEITKVPDVEVPDVSNMDVASAEEKLKEVGFTVNVTIEKEEHSKVKKGRVIKTEPSKGRKIKKGTQITIYESLGDKVYVVEDYIGSNYIEIQTLLENVHKLKVIIEKKEVLSNNDYDKQEIIEQSIKKGTKLSKGDTIILYIPDIEDGYPNMVEEEWKVADVEAFCAKHKLKCKYEEEIPDTYVTPGTVIRQNRLPKSPIISGFQFSVTIAVEPADSINPTGPSEDQ